MLVGAVVVTGDRSCTDIGGSADRGVADVAQVVGLHSGREVGGFDFDEVADVNVVIEFGAGAEAGKRADDAAWTDVGTFDMAERADRNVAGHGDAWTEEHVRARW